MTRAVVLVLVMLLGPVCQGWAASSANAGECSSCHRQQTARFAHTPMAQALVSVAGSDILRQHPDLSFREDQYQSRLVRDGERTLLSVTNGAETLTVPLLWAFGQGQAGQTYVFERNGALYESRVSFFNAIQKLDLTMGAQNTKPADLEQAAGRRMEPADARDCFGCHSSGGVVQSRLQLETLSPGIACASCHTGAPRHAAAVRAGRAVEAKMPRLSNLAAEEMSELCGRCHRTWSQIALNGPRGVNNVRFQPYRLTNSKCYDATDSRIRCTACHDPHVDLETRTTAYDAACMACHSTAAHGKICRVAKQDCVSCHMPKIDLPGAHARFTDHQIRIVRANEPYPN